MSDDHGKAEIVTVPPSELQSRDAQDLAPIVRAALDASAVNPDNLEKLMALQERHEANESRKAFNRAKAALKEELPTVLDRDKTVAFEGRSGVTSYQHTTLAYAMDAITGPLVKHGFDASWRTEIEGKDVKVTCVLAHAAGHSDSTWLKAPPDTTGLKNPAQAIASTVTLLERYTLLGLLGIATRDMTEPEGREPDPSAVNVDRNMRAMRSLTKVGITKTEAEAHVEKPIGEWTGTDLAALRELYASQADKQPDDGTLTEAEEAQMEQEMGQ